MKIILSLIVALSAATSYASSGLCVFGPMFEAKLQQVTYGTFEQCLCDAIDSLPRHIVGLSGNDIVSVKLFACPTDHPGRCKAVSRRRAKYYKLEAKVKTLKDTGACQ